MTEDTTAKPMRDEDLSYARTVGRMMSDYAPDLEQASETIEQLLAEIERLRTLEIDREWAAVDEKVLAKLQAWYDASRPIVERVAEGEAVDGFHDSFTCAFCHMTDEEQRNMVQIHAPDCVVTLARAALGKESGQ